jgi:hypothetical protein
MGSIPYRMYDICKKKKFGVCWGLVDKISPAFELRNSGVPAVVRSSQLSCTPQRGPKFNRGGVWPKAAHKVRVQTRVRSQRQGVRVQIWLWTQESESKPESDRVWTQEPESTCESDRVWTQESESTWESDPVWIQESESTEESDFFFIQESESTWESDLVRTQEPESTEESDSVGPKSPIGLKSPDPKKMDLVCCLGLAARWGQTGHPKAALPSIACRLLRLYLLGSLQPICTYLKQHLQGKTAFAALANLQSEDLTL